MFAGMFGLVVEFLAHLDPHDPLLLRSRLMTRTVCAVRLRSPASGAPAVPRSGFLSMRSAGSLADGAYRRSVGFSLGGDGLLNAPLPRPELAGTLFAGSCACPLAGFALQLQEVHWSDARLGDKDVQVFEEVECTQHADDAREHDGFAGLNPLDGGAANAGAVSQGTLRHVAVQSLSGETSPDLAESRLVSQVPVDLH